MRWTYTIGRVGETEIKLHLTFFLLLAYWAAGGYEAGGMSGAIGAVAMLIALFVCVLLHEFGHITMARRFGVRTPDVHPPADRRRGAAGADPRRAPAGAAHRPGRARRSRSRSSPCLPGPPR